LSSRKGNETSSRNPRGSPLGKTKKGGRTRQGGRNVVVGDKVVAPLPLNEDGRALALLEYMRGDTFLLPPSSVTWPGHVFRSCGRSLAIVLSLLRLIDRDHDSVESHEQLGSPWRKGGERRRRRRRRRRKRRKGRRGTDGIFPLAIGLSILRRIDQDRDYVESQ